jgi:dienelactone hydrolase
MTEDRRLRRVAHWQDTVSMPRYSTLQEWLARKEYIRQRVLFSAGLLPALDRTPLNPIVTGRTEGEGYTVENVAFESFPGFYCTGNLYRPAGQPSPGRLPAILTPHGHWREGRFAQRPEGSVPARCINFARQGYAAFSPDMVGYNDSRQVPHREFDSVHRSLWGIGSLGLQLWNNIRALDYLLSLDEVDPERIGCTGESGGATQTYLLAAVDDRVRFVAPVNMLSAHYAGGCVCENAPGLRLDLTNLEIVAAAAPRPMLLVAATGDWTVNTPRVEYPPVHSIYELYGVPDRLECVQIDAGHNYNLASREAVYGFFARYLDGHGTPTERPSSAVFWTGPSEPLAELTGSAVQDLDALRVFPEGNLPAGALADGSAVVKALTVTFRGGGVADLHPGKDAVDRFKGTYGPLYQMALNVLAPSPDDVSLGHRQRQQRTGYAVESLQIGSKRFGEGIPATFVTPAEGAEQSDAVPVLLVSSEGRRAWLADESWLLDEDAGEGRDSARKDALQSTFGPLCQELLASGRPVLMIDAFLTGAYQSPLGITGRPVSERHFATYNQVDVAWRVQDVVTGAVALSRLTGREAIDVVGGGDAGLWCLLARPFLSALVRRLVADLESFDWTDEAEYMRRLCLPHLLRLGGLATAVALAAPAPLFLQNTAGKLPELLRDLYAVLGAPEALVNEDVTV